jgi:CheY-like chemotaxis protein
VSAARILLVDDQVQVSRMLRSSLEFSGREYVVVDVPSGEEAMVELARGSIDLLVTDLVLPGISGIALIQKARELNPNMRSIIITGHPSAEARARAEELGVVVFMTKPIRTSYFLEAVERALTLSMSSSSPVKMADDGMRRLVERLKVMQGELGADSVLLLDEGGHILARSDQGIDLNLETALPALMTAFRAGLKVSSLLESLLPTNFQYFDGDTHDIYLTNVGAFYGLLIIYRGKQEAGKLGSVVHYGRRAVNDLLEILSVMGSAIPSARAEYEESWESTIAQPMGTAAEEIDIEAMAELGEKVDANEYWERAVSDPAGYTSPEGEALTYEQARKLGLLSGKPGKKPSESE